MAKEHRLVSGFSRKDRLFGSDPGGQSGWNDLHELKEEDVWGDGENSHLGDRQEESFLHLALDKKVDNFDSSRFKNKERSRMGMDFSEFSDLGRSWAGEVSVVSLVPNGGAGHEGRRDGVSGRALGTSRLNIQQLGSSPRQLNTADVPKSAPVNVPDWTKVIGKSEENDDEEEGEVKLPPHEILAREYAKSQAMTFSVIEGAGRTLKGMDLRRVRNAVWRRTGFID